MTTKFKILSSVAFIALAIVLTFVGVWALTDLDFTVGGNITYTAPEPESILKHDEENGYYYVEMGTYSGSAVRWRLVGIKENGATATTRFDATTMPKPTSGQGTFILETLIEEVNALKKIFDADSNDYATSDIRKYLTNENAGGYIYDILGITAPATDAIYSAIDARDMTSLYTDIGWNAYQGYSGCAENEIYTITTSVTGTNKLWLMSVAEVYTLLGGGTIGNDKLISTTWGDDIKAGCNWSVDKTSDYYWLRTPCSDLADASFCINNMGECIDYDVDIDCALRPAFNLEF